MQVPNNLWIVLCNLQKFHNRSTLLFLWRSSDNNWSLTYRKLSNLLLLPHLLAFSHHLYPAPYFWWLCVYSCHFPCRSAFIQPFTNFPGYPWRGSQTTQSHPSVHGELAFFGCYLTVEPLLRCQCENHPTHRFRWYSSSLCTTWHATCHTKSTYDCRVN